MTHINCPKCGNRASKYLSPVWDDLFLCAWVVVDIVVFIAMLVFFVFGKYWYVFALVAAGLLVWLAIKWPKKYICRACKYKFIFQPNKAEQPNDALQTDGKLRQG